MPSALPDGLPRGQALAEDSTVMYQAPSAGAAKTLDAYCKRRAQAPPRPDPLFSGADPDDERFCIRDARFAAFLTALRERAAQNGERRRVWPWRSCFVLDLNNPVRQAAIRLMEHRAFGIAIQLVILANTIFLAMSSNAPGFPDTRIGRAMPTAELFFTFAFLAEMLVKVVAMGFVGAPGAYIRDGWNVLDFAVVVLGVVPLLPWVNSGSNFSSVRVVRVFRPLRTIRGIRGMRVLITAIIASLPMLLDVVLLCLFLFVLFGIVGVDLFGGALRKRCQEAVLDDNGALRYVIPEQLPDDTVVWEDTVCTGHAASGTTFAPAAPGTEGLAFTRLGPAGAGFVCPSPPDRDPGLVCAPYENPHAGVTGFDNILQASVTVFQVLTIEGWTEILYALQDGVNPWLPSIFLLLLLVLGVYFTLPTFVAVLYKQFRRESERDREAREWEAPGGAEEEGAREVPADVAQGPRWWAAVRVACWRLCHHPAFDYVSMALIVANVAVLAAEHVGMPESQRRASDVINVALTVFFAAEMLLKHVALGWRRYWTARMNVFDATVVAASVAELVITAALPGRSSAALSVLRAFRIFRVFKLAKRWRELHRLLATMAASINSVAYLLVLLALILVIYALLGMQLFGYYLDTCPVPGSRQLCPDDLGFPCPLHRDCFVDCDPSQAGAWIDVPESPYGGRALCQVLTLHGVPAYLAQVGPADVPYASYDSFGWALLSTFQVLAIYKWSAQLFRAMAATGPGAFFYYFTLVVAGVFVLLSLFLAILLENFDGYAADGDEASQGTGAAGRIVSALRGAIGAAGSRMLGSLTGSGTGSRGGGGSRHGSAARLGVSGARRAEGGTPDGDRKAGAERSERSERSEGDADSMHGPSVRPGPVAESADWGRGSPADTAGGTSETAPASAAGAGARPSRASDEPQREGEGPGRAWEGGAPRRKGTARVMFRLESEPTRRGTPEWEEESPGEWEEESPGGPEACRPRAATEGGDAGGDAGLSSGAESRTEATMPGDGRGGRGGPGTSRLKGGARASLDVARSGEGLVSARSGESPSARLSEGLLARMQSQAGRRGRLRKRASLVSHLRSFVGLEASGAPGEGEEEEEGASVPASEGRTESVGLADRDRADLEAALRDPALLCLPGEPHLHPLRRAAAWAMRQRWFDGTSLLLIAWSSLMLAMDEPGLDPAGRLKRTINALDVFFTVAFAAEAAVKITALGFCLGPHSYLRSGYNVLDFAVVCLSIVLQALQASGVGRSNLSGLRALRAARALRPMRMAVRLPQLRVIVSAIVGTLPAVVNVLLVCFLFFLVAAVMGVQFFGGAFGRCVDVDTGDDLPCYRFRPRGQCFTQAECASGILTATSTWFHSAINATVPPYSVSTRWERYPEHFDDTGAALLTLFEVSSAQGWSDVMFRAVDSRSPDPATGQPRPPVRGARRAASAFFVAFMLLSNFFLLRLFVGILVDRFSQMKRRNEGRSLFLTENQQRWINLRRMAILTGTLRRSPRPERSPIRRACYDLVTAPAFESAVVAVVVANIAAMAMDHYDMSPPWQRFSFYSNVAFTACYCFEAAAKLTALGPTGYFRDPWHVFDFAVAAASVVGIGLAPAPTASARGGLGVVALVRVFRVARIFRLVPRARGLRLLLQTLLTSLPALWNVGAIFLLFSFIYAVVGMQLFGNIRFGTALNRHENFGSFLGSMGVVLQIATGETWTEVMRDTLVVDSCALMLRDVPSAGLRSGDWVNGPHGSQPNVHTYGLTAGVDYRNQCSIGAAYSILYFFSYVIFISYLMVNMIIAVILDNYMNSSEDETFAVRKEDIQLFREVWSKHDPDGTGRVPAPRLPFIVDDLPPPLGMGGQQASLSALTQFLLRCDIPDRDGLVTFHEVLYALAHKAALDAMPQLRDEVQALVASNHKEEARFWRKLKRTVGHDPTKPPKYSVAHHHAAVAVQAAVRGCMTRLQARSGAKGEEQGDEEDLEGLEGTGGRGSKSGEEEGEQEMGQEKGDEATGEEKGR